MTSKVRLDLEAFFSPWLCPKTLVIIFRRRFSILIKAVYLSRNLNLLVLKSSCESNVSFIVVVNEVPIFTDSEREATRDILHLEIWDWGQFAGILPYQPNWDWGHYVQQVALWHLSPGWNCTFNHRVRVCGHWLQDITISGFFLSMTDAIQSKICNLQLINDKNILVTTNTWLTEFMIYLIILTVPLSLVVRFMAARLDHSP